jgi:hypothetical protein
MSVGSGTRAPPNPLRAAELMATIAKAELGVDVQPAAILAMFVKRWQRLSDLAHAMHETARMGER